MKLFVVTILAVVLSLASAAKSPEEVESEVLAYVQAQVASVVRKPSLARAGGGLACYDKYIPMITAATENSKSDTADCNARASSRRTDELNKVQEQRATLDLQVKTIQDTLAACVNQEDALNYLICFRDNSQLLQSTVEAVTTSATSLANGLSAAYVSIDNAEDLCIQSVLDKVKADTDALTVALQNCLMNGFDDPQPESSTSEAPSSEASSEAPSSEASSEAPSSEASSEAPAPEDSNSSSAAPSQDSDLPDVDLLPEEQL